MFCLIFTFLLSFKKFFWICFNSTITVFGTFVIIITYCYNNFYYYEKLLFFIPKIRQSFNITYVFDSFTKVQVFLNFFVFRNMYSEHFYTFSRLIFFIPQSATFTFVRIHIPAIFIEHKFASLKCSWVKRLCTDYIIPLHYVNKRLGKHFKFPRVCHPPSQILPKILSVFFLSMTWDKIQLFRQIQFLLLVFWLFKDGQSRPLTRCH